MYPRRPKHTDLAACKSGHGVDPSDCLIRRRFKANELGFNDAACVLWPFVSSDEAERRTNGGLNNVGLTRQCSLVLRILFTSSNLDRIQIQSPEVPGGSSRCRFMNNLSDSTTANHDSLSFSGSYLVQTFPRHDTVKLDEGNFVQWQQHIRLIVEGYELLGFLKGTLPVSPHFITSSDGVLAPNPDSSLFV
ncbi:hypothetical protein J1N35_012066 [Gossypium stocksii]|uniref:Retrotransposon Copia-like N-terminal domain-containing protein n=1 Tax=Gossypium stocksii TaxID=47602 RepID=A0A9D4AE00_9ROSI|nr:hypothetical protein J1N35_012066 [Gossypium stocksii]